MPSQRITASTASHGLTVYPSTLYCPTHTWRHHCCKPFIRAAVFAAYVLSRTVRRDSHRASSDRRPPRPAYRCPDSAAGCGWCGARGRGLASTGVVHPAAVAACVAAPESRAKDIAFKSTGRFHRSLLAQAHHWRNIVKLNWNLSVKFAWEVQWRKHILQYYTSRLAPLLQYLNPAGRLFDAVAGIVGTPALDEAHAQNAESAQVIDADTSRHR